jgi:hypothetical protein
MWLIVWYVGLMIAGDVADYLIGLVVESLWGPTVSLWAFLALYFFSLWLAWIIAVRMTEPKKMSELPG